MSQGSDLAEAPPSAAPALPVFRRYGIPVILFAALAVAPLLAALGAEGYFLSLLSRVMILAIAASM